MARKKSSPQARHWQVWLYSALDDGVTYWLHLATPDYHRAKAEYDRLTKDYSLAELRTPLGRVIESHNAVRVDMDALCSLTYLYPETLEAPRR